MKKSRLLIVGLVAATLSAFPFVASIGASGGGSSNTDLVLIGDVIELVEHYYVHPVGTDELTKDALKGMLTRLDPHSDYMDEQEFQEMQTNMSGMFGGLGIEISEQNGTPKVIAPIDGTPAARAGIQPGDLIISIDGQSTHGVSLTKIVPVLRGKPGTTVTLGIMRGSKEPFDVTITRKIIKVKSVKSKLEPNRIAYVRITVFGDDTPNDVKQVTESLKQQAGGPINGLVLDLRNDPGGLLTSAVAVASDFLKGGKVVTIKGRRSDDNHTFNAPLKGELLPRPTPMVVLINGASASASEIVAGALQDRHRATIMGTQSFGKGSVQTVIPLKGHGALRLTTALYYTPSGRSIQDQGIEPNIVIRVPKDQQITGALMSRESALRGAFRNPGSLNKPATTGNQKQTAGTAKRTIAPLIKSDLIGTADDAQLKAALAYIQGKSGGMTGKRSQP
jgi:carboxyl-terminal processing protease